MFQVRMRGLALAAVFSSLFAFQASAQIVIPGGPLDQWGTSTSARTASCPSFCTSFAGPFDSGQEVAVSDSSFSDSRGNAAGSAMLNAGSGISVPNLRAEAFVTGSGTSSAFGRASGVEGYTYSGAEARTFNLDIMLTGSVFDPTPADGDTSINASVYIFTAPGFQFGFDYATLVFELGVTELAGSQLSLGNGETALADSLSFTLQPGQSFYLQAALGADAERDLSIADAFSTLSASFEDATGLVAASGTVVPEPSTAVLFLLGLGGLASAGRRSA